jgi:hypothetical protein
MKRNDKTGRRYGRLTVIALEPTENGRVRWRCRCDCGAVVVVASVNLRRNAWHTSSCGCLKKDKKGVAVTHGETVNGRHSVEYRLWHDIIRRCEDDGRDDYENYGARGIRMSALWRHDVAAFVRHIGRRPTAHHTIDRIDPNGDYEPGNVRWATRTNQNQNTRRVWLCDIDGQRIGVQEAARRLALDNPRLLYNYYGRRFRQEGRMP